MERNLVDHITLEKNGLGLRIMKFMLSLAFPLISETKANYFSLNSLCILICKIGTASRTHKLKSIEEKNVHKMIIYCEVLYRYM